MKFEDLPSARKGAIGEQIVDDWLLAKGWVPYRPVKGTRHPFDRLVARADKRELCIVEVKTKPRREAYKDTGINQTHFDDYQHVTATYRIPLFLAFVDEVQQCVYGNWWSELLKKRTGDEAIVDMIHGGYPWSHRGIVYFPLSAMTPIARLSEEQCQQLRALRRTNWVKEDMANVNR